MKKTVFLLVTAMLLLPGMTAAQNIVLGQKVPELKLAGWLAGQMPSPAQITYVEFFYSANPACRTSMQRLKELSNQFENKLRVVVIAQEKEEVVAPLLSAYLSRQISVGLDPGGRIATAFGVNYVPFGVLLDSKNRALWLGNSLLLTPELIKKIIK